MSLNLIVALLLMGLTGYLDGQAFGKAPYIWDQHGLDRTLEIVKTVSLFLIGLLTYISSTYFLHQQGIENALIITLIWFAATIVSLVVFSGSFSSLSYIDKLISIAAIILVGILYVRGVAK